MALEASSIPIPPNSGIKITRVEGVDSDDIARRQLQDREDQYRGHKARMSWTDIGKNPKKGPKAVGRIDKNYPYSLVEGRFYIQNCKAYLGNGLTEIDPYTYQFDVNPSESERLRARVLDAFLSYNQAALEEDALLCPYCLKFHATTPLQFADHVVKDHAGQYGQRLSFDEPAKEPEKPVEIEHMAPAPPGYVSTSTPVETVKDETGHPSRMQKARPALDLTPLVCVAPCNCGKTFMGQPGLKRHITGFKKRQAKG